ncbi:uncharacterized protein YpiB (UPF0302 family) [Virgibacillus natechei]|uniref:Uncharacterized protein YpiB (UPF0302 family) n=1 Tax=Virgibacillus natechei TaxID=1216297 RepID=A0ABS4IKW8_9BACI|nr:IDEAL domain-containing protein [Virgibacillus natechei]MBP1971195.1 uncharacterized protein YpiB (UPF0302 family) [Virgibacillus natechei]UZD11942.1 IDEAL domain-containing protein [Virgibacillus natechei]
MVTVNMLKAYYIKEETEHIRVILAYQYFSVLINQRVYQFIPVEAKEIHINRSTREVENTEDKFAFQKGKDIVYMTMSELTALPDFLNQLNTIAEPYYLNESTVNRNDQLNETTIMIDKLERQNLQRLIDKSLDERNESAFYSLVKLL